MSSNNFASIEKVITCDLCSEFYDDPRLLPCSHMYCFRCINQVFSTNKNSFQCPSCDGTKMTQDDIDSLPSNQVIDDTVELYNLMQRSTMCANCEISTAEYICDTCQVDFCLKCYETIHSARALQSHQKMGINKKFSGILQCSEHPDEKLKHWCQECHRSICSDCRRIEHNDHTCHLVNSAAKELETKIERDFEMIQSTLNDKLKQIDTLLNKINLNSQSNKREVIKAMTFLRQIIDKHEKQMLENIEHFQREEMKQIEDYQIILENQLKYSDIQKQILNLIISVNDQIRLLKNKPQFLSYINQTNDLLVKLQIPIGINYHISGIEQLQDIKEQIILCAKVVETSKQFMQISPDEKPQIEELITQHLTSQQVNLDRQSLADQNIHFIIQILNKSTTMSTLILSNNQISHEGIEQLADVLRNNKILTTLDLSNNQISDEGAKYLANVLKTNTTLITLYLYDNGISDEGTQYLADALENNTTLTVLDLQSNRISNLGAQYLSKALRKNDSLTTLYLSNNQIGNQGAQYLADALQQNKTLTMLMLSDNQIDHEAKRRVIEILKTNAIIAVYW